LQHIKKKMKHCTFTFSIVPSLYPFSSANIPCAMLIFKRILYCVNYDRHIFSTL